MPFPFSLCFISKTMLKDVMSYLNYAAVCTHWQLCVIWGAEWVVCQEENASKRSMCSQVSDKHEGCVGNVTFAVEYLRIEGQLSLAVLAGLTNSRAYCQQNGRTMRNFQSPTNESSEHPPTPIHFKPHQEQICVCFHIAVASFLPSFFILWHLLHLFLFFFSSTENISTIGCCSADN